ncbi:probable xyloglucan endotransglucosylase/hydrolase protein 33 [Andrographis paniculata]|uniref:probable xyloglucan endotransglucosylase/hydrolase protein 33 n=1 Tax=Andrographis paniculata TaxID=175694 RepID=UPI0021E92BCD|nr:probable xyloglucan endotransglucosylase/hydrolase protein 33 [Andrographis paniculata]
MAISAFLYSYILVFSWIVGIYAAYEPTSRFRMQSVNQTCNVFFGRTNVHARKDGRGVNFSLDKLSGSGIVSKNKYYYGFFNGAIKLPAGFTSGVVVAYYLSNADAFPHNHDEMDIELLGHEKRGRWVLQTNIYGNGSVKTGREEKFHLWFDPTKGFHNFSILWNIHHVVFMVDDIPVREVVHDAAISSIYPSKPMSVYTTIWDGSEWATHGGKYPVDYKYAPFVASMRGIEMEGCVWNQKNHTHLLCSRRTLSSLDPVGGEQFAKLSSRQRAGMEWARRNHMFYSYCQDKKRYRVLPLECREK